MANRMYLDKLLKITLVTRGVGKTAKHPMLRDGVVEAVKAADTPTYDDRLAEVAGIGSTFDDTFFRLIRPRMTQEWQLKTAAYKRY